MKQEVKTYPNWKKNPPNDGILFVRTRGIFTTMVRAPLILIGLIIVAITMPSQAIFGNTKTLDLAIYPDGSTHVYSEFSVDPLEPDFSIALLGDEIDNFVAEDEDGYLLSGEIQGNLVVVETLGSTFVSIDYDTHDLVSKSGRIWSFIIDSPIDYSLLMPQNSVIVGMSNIPLNMQVLEEQSQLSLPSGPLEINYFFGSTSTPPVNPPPIQNPGNPDSNQDYLFYLVGGVAAAGAIGAILFLKNSKRVTKVQIPQSSRQISTIEERLTPEIVFRARPDLRDDDKELINFIYENGGQAFESELRKKFLQPRTTMWRAVKRLERNGIIEIEKRELQNLVKLKTKLEDE